MKKIWAVIELDRSNPSCYRREVAYLVSSKAGAERLLGTLEENNRGSGISYYIDDSYNLMSGNEAKDEARRILQ